MPTPAISIQTFSNKLTLKKGERAILSVTITNLSQGTLTDLFFRESPTLGASFIHGTVTINGTAHPDYDPYEGFALIAIAPERSTTITFAITPTEPVSTKTIVSTATVSFKVETPTYCSLTQRQTSNPVTIALL
jgi:uncharacterized repeat protein (TIGR01451 family)